MFKNKARKRVSQHAVNNWKDWVTQIGDQDSCNCNICRAEASLKRVWKPLCVFQLINSHTLTGKSKLPLKIFTRFETAWHNTSGPLIRFASWERESLPYTTVYWHSIKGAKKTYIFSWKLSAFSALRVHDFCFSFEHRRPNKPWQRLHAFIFRRVSSSWLRR